MKKKTIAFFALMIVFTSCQTSRKTVVQTSTPTPTKEPAVSSTKERMVLISTSFGDMKVKLYNATPKHRDNFIKLVQDGFYDSLLFHRIIRNFMIQGGDPLSKHAAPGVMLGNGDNGYTIPAEFVDTIFHKKGSLCAARTENPTKASSGCQFYIVQGQVMTNEQLNQFEIQRGLKLSTTQREIMSTIGGTPWLDHNYTVYGEVVEGLDVIDKIVAVKTAPGDRPLEDIRIKMKIIQ